MSVMALATMVESIGRSTLFLERVQVRPNLESVSCVGEVFAELAKEGINPPYSRVLGDSEAMEDPLEGCWFSPSPPDLQRWGGF